MAAESPTARILPSAIATAPGWPRPVDSPVQTEPPWITRSALEAQAVSNASATTHDIRRTKYLLAELGDTTDGVERRHRTGAGVGLFRLRGSAHGVANVEQDFQQQLLALIRGIEIDHAAVVFGRLGALVRFSINGLEIVENLLSRSWTHRGERYRFRA